MQRTCLDCGEILIGRADKKFCCDQCRNNYNNRNNNDKSETFKSINASLRKNRKILAALNPRDKTTIHKEKLAVQGFNFTYITHLYTTQKGTIYRFVYEYGYLPLDNDFYMLVVREKK